MQERHQRGEITRDTCQANINKLFDPNRYKQKQTSTNSPDEPSSKNNTLQERHQRGEITRDTCQANINKLFDTNVYKRKQTSTNSPDEPSNKKAQQVHCGQDDDMLPRQPDELMMFVRLNEFHMEKLLREPLSEPKSILLTWKVKNGVRTIFLVETGSGGKISARVTIDEVTPIRDFATLRLHPEFVSSHSTVKKALRERITQVKRPVYAWTLKDVILINHLQIPRSYRSKTFTMTRADICSLKDIPIPEMRLKSTCKYFTQKLVPYEYEKLRKTALQLDNVVIRMGSTCSGTDVAWSVVRETFAAINEEFSVPSLHIRKNVRMNRYRFSYQKEWKACT